MSRLFKFVIYKTVFFSSVLGLLFSIFVVPSPEAKVLAQSATQCNSWEGYQGTFDVRVGSKSVSEVDSNQVGITLYAKWEPKENCKTARIDGRSTFYAVNSNGSRSRVGTEQNIVMTNNSGSSVHMYTQRVDGINDFTTGRPVQNGGSIKLMAELKTSIGTLTTTPISVKVKAPATTDLNSCQVEMYWRSNNKDFKEGSAKINDTYTIRVQYYSSANDNSCNARKMTVKVNKGQEQDRVFPEFTTTSGGFKDLTYKFPAEGTYQAFVTTKTSTSSVQRSTGVVTVQGTASGGGTNSGGGGGGGGSSANPTPSTSTPGGTSGTGSGGGKLITGNGCDASKILCNPLKYESLGQLMLALTKAFIVLVAAWAVLYIVIGGFRLIISQGNSEAVTKAKDTIFWAIAGVVVSLLAFSLVAIVQNLVGFVG